MNIFAITGPTASGKSDLALELAQKNNGVILSVDSLAVYKEIDIASAKPSKEELSLVRHFGIDELYPDEKFSAIEFIKQFKEAKNWAKEHGKSLIIVGGTSFYLKVLTQGISDLPKTSKSAKEKVDSLLLNLNQAYKTLQKIDPKYAANIAPGDKYRIEKALSIYYTTNTPPSLYFQENPPKAIEPNLPIFEIKIERELLRERIKLRTAKMLQEGLIDEVAYLEHKYGRIPQSMGAIGIKEVLDYFDGIYSKQELEEKIAINTARLAKRQVTFNKSQLNIEFSGSTQEIKSALFHIC